MTKQHKLLLGAHTSIADGLDKAIERGASIGCSTIQIFTKSNRQWAAKEITSQEAEQFKEKQQQFSIAPIIVHATYLINIGSPDKDIRHKSQQALITELNRCAQINAPAIVLHPGSHTQAGEQKCLDAIAESLDIVLEATNGTTNILLEIMAGQGSTVCYSFEHLAYVLEKSHYKNNLGVCFDTCHAFAAGYDFRTKETYEKMWDHFDATIGLNRLQAMHINDSKKELGSRVDRHEKIGKGKLGLEPFRLLFNDKRFVSVPKILETPEGTLEDYAKDMETIKTLLTQETKDYLGLDE